MARTRQRTLSNKREFMADPGKSARLTATQAKNEFDKQTPASERSLDTLSEEFDALLARMQTAKARGAMKAAFEASPAEMGKAALRAAQRSRRRS